MSWASCYSAIPAQGVFSPAEPQRGETVLKPASPFIIDTSFDFGLKKNFSTSGRYKRANRREVYNYTQSQRKLAQRAVPATSLSDLRQKVGISFCFSGTLNPSHSSVF
jgi:hypothetical protein